MTVFPDIYSPKLIEMIAGGAIGVLLTDTLYGVVAQADNESAVARVYEIKNRTYSKPPIVLIGDISQLYDPLDDEIASIVNGLWPGKNSIVLPAPSAPEWLVRGSDGVAYRLPDHAGLRDLLRQTGPLIAPSANPENRPPAKTIGEAQGYFGDSVDFYVDSGVAFNEVPSNVYNLVSGELVQLR